MFVNIHAVLRLVFFARLLVTSLGAQTMACVCKTLPQKREQASDIWVNKFLDTIEREENNFEL